MKKPVLTLGIALAALFAANSFAQTKGEVDPAQSQAVPSKKATPAEKSQAREARKAEGKKVAKTADVADDKPGTGATAGVPKAERQAAAAKRRADTGAAMKKGEVPMKDNDFQTKAKK